MINALMYNVNFFIFSRYLYWTQVNVQISTAKQENERKFDLLKKNGLRIVLHLIDR